MLWLKAFHIVAMVAWFAGLFYLPRLYVYHASTVDTISLERFKVMEWRLFYAIMYPAAILTTLMGIGMVYFAPGYYLHQWWFLGKMIAVGFVWIYHIACGILLKKFAADKNCYSSQFYRFFNEIPTLLLVVIVILVVVKP
ncbi:MAG: protoporphyrinogen oxidase HemJ [Gammaproteobacteria bacterium]|nr:protoporphyrinogen oxidase HemJ [Gammaproteobacteria bacterium]